jgi:uncharacterized membrane protein YhaH (DUF805 family)
MSWLFFGFSGRVSRQVYALAGLLLYVLRMYPAYKILTATDQETVTYWGGVLLLVLGIMIPSHVALSAKRLHDTGVSGWFSVFFLLGDIIVYLILCLVPGQRGPNQYGDITNAPNRGGSS